MLADQLGFRDAFISEHHGEVPFIDKVDTIPAPELMICKAAALTRRIRMGAAVKLIHLHHPLDTAIQAAVVDHLLGGRPLHLRVRWRLRQSGVQRFARPELSRTATPGCAKPWSSC